ncbi:hypothetical protein ANN_18668 [Periplaneta americana]|uniref:Uncharacterized protein n=1 Tax=Periplaneta americana TaxID=6978 RepID=A0ABQ8SQM0_PERAM|nr:hypothetical protein ANN_18668 [Periplaneta americana]
MLLHKSWADIKMETISNCFRKAGFSYDDSGLDDGKEDEKELTIPTPDEWLQYQQIACSDADYDTFVTVDSQAIVAENPMDAGVFTVRMGQNSATVDPGVSNEDEIVEIGQVEC